MQNNFLLITGGLGLVGKSLIKILNKRYKIKIIDTRKQITRNKNYIKKFDNKKIEFLPCDILNKKKLDKVFKKVKIVIHLAAMLGVQNTERRKDLCWKINAIGTYNIVNSCIKHKVKKLIFTSSSEVYGEQLSKKKISENSPILGKNIYAQSKISAENYIKLKLNKKRTKYTILRLFNTYGENQVVQFFISKLCYSAVKKKFMIINGSGDQIRSYAYSDDIAQGIKSCIINEITNGKIYNLGNSKEIFSLKQVVEEVSKLSTNKLKIKYTRKFLKSDRTYKREIFRRVCENSKAKKEINFIPKTTLIKGLKIMLNQKSFNLNWPQ